MERTYRRQTIKTSWSLEGPGLHSGSACRVTVHPGERGFVLVVGSERIEISPDAVTDTSRCTRIGPVSTVEHILSALSGMGVTDAEIEVEGGELPAADGCSLPYCVEIQRVGLADCGELTVEGPYARVFKQELPSKYAVGVGEGWWRAAYLREESFIGRQEVELAWSPEIYIREIAPARTFVLEEELDMARAAGLGKGLSESSCLLIKADSYGNSARFTDEPARHKLLDVIGDLALTGIPIAHLDVVAEFTGHQLNVRVAQKLALDVKLTRR